MFPSEMWNPGHCII